MWCSEHRGLENKINWHKGWEILINGHNGKMWLIGIKDV